MVKTYKERIINEEAFINAMGRITIKFALIEELVTDCINILIGGRSCEYFDCKIIFHNYLSHVH